MQTHLHLPLLDKHKAQTLSHWLQTVSTSGANESRCFPLVSTDPIANSIQLHSRHTKRSHLQLFPIPPPAMDSPTVVAAAEMLPRFLLPRLSWGPPSSQVARPLISSHHHHHHHHQRRSFQTASPPPTPRCCARRAESPILKRAFHATAVRQRDHHFDTLKFVKRLQSEGFTEEQSVAMMKVLNDVIEER